MTSQPAVSPLRTFKILAAALMGALVIIGVALTFVLASGPTNDNESTPLWPYLIVAAMGTAATGVIQLIGYRVTPLPAGEGGDTMRTRVIATYQQLMILRFAIAESVAIASIALTFVVEPPTITVYLLGGAISLVLMAIHVWPQRRIIDRVQQGLDSAGGSSNLSSILI